MNAVALATSPARVNLSGKTPIAAPAASGPASQPKGPRSVFSRKR